MKLNRLISIVTAAAITLSLMTFNVYAAVDKDGSLLNKIINAITDGAMTTKMAIKALSISTIIRKRIRIYMHGLRFPEPI